MSRSTGRRVPASLFVTMAWCAVGTLLLVVSPMYSAPLRTTVQSAVLPGRRVIHSTGEQIQTLVSQWAPQPPEVAELDKLRSERDEAMQNVRRLQIRAALLAEKMEQLQQTGPLPVVGESSTPLVVPELLEATVFGEETTLLWRSGRMIDAGTEAGVLTDNLVLEADDTPVLDQGAESGVLVDQPVYSGRCIVGKIATAGRWTSTVQPVTDPQYRGLAQILRGGQQNQFAAQGVLEGRGDGTCALKYVSSTEAVSVGDDVCSGGREAAFPFPMYYGKVTRAELKPGATHWTIIVEPAVSVDQWQTVSVFRKVINPERIRTASADSQRRSAN